MILINKKQVDIADLDKLLGIKIPLDILRKKPLFEINPALILKDPANGPLATRHRHMMEFPCVFHAILKSGTNVEIRYCTNRTPDAKFMGQTEKYSPRVVEFEGKAEFVKDDLDKAVYFWLHFFNKTSPFKKTGVPFEYELVDDTARAEAIISGLTLRSKATAHAAALSGDEMRITAKGMKIAGSDRMDDLSIKAQLMQYASDKPAEYLNKAESQVNHIEGLIRDSIDKGIFIIENVFNSKRWRWGMGVKQGEVIVEMSTSVADEIQALITHISQNIQVFLPVLIDTSKTVNAKSNLESVVGNIDVFAMLKKQPETNYVGGIDPYAGVRTKSIVGEDVEQAISNDFSQFESNTQKDPFNDSFTDDDLGDDPDLHFNEDEVITEETLPTSYKEAQAYLGEKIGKKTPALASRLMAGIEDKSITLGNIEMILAEYREL